VLTALLKNAGDIAAGQGRVEESTAAYLKGLHLLLEVLGREEVFETPEFVPKVEEFVTSLQNSPLPSQTLVSLMRHYERIGEFARAENNLYSLLTAEANASAVLEFGIDFYKRLLDLSDTTLAAGNLPRTEVEEGLA